MKRPCPACAVPFSAAEVRTDATLIPGRTYYGFDPVNHRCPHCNALLRCVKPKSVTLAEAAQIACIGAMLCFEFTALASFAHRRWAQAALFGLLVVVDRISRHLEDQFALFELG